MGRKRGKTWNTTVALLRLIARDEKVNGAVRLAAIDRLALMDEIYEAALSAPVTAPNPTGFKPALPEVSKEQIDEALKKFQ